MNEQDFPICLTVRDVALILRVGINKAYDLSKRSDFPKIKDGSRIIVPRDAFFRWINDTASRSEAS